MVRGGLPCRGGTLIAREEMLEGRTDEPALTDAQFEKALRLAVAEFKAEGFVKRRRRRGAACKAPRSA